MRLRLYRDEERLVGKASGDRGRPDQIKKKKEQGITSQSRVLIMHKKRPDQKSATQKSKQDIYNNSKQTRSG